MLKRILGIFLALFGCGLFFYPEVSSYYQTRYMREYVEEFQLENNGLIKSEDKRYKESVLYNNKINEEKQNSFKNEWICTQSSVFPQWSDDNRLGYLKIPVMDLKLPLFAGASKKNMACGAAVLGGTSLPVGGINTNSVIAGHRGYKGSLFFKEIEKLKCGDKVYVKNPWEELVYVVESRKIIDPYDIDSVKIQKGKDMITLITCHPYRSNGKYRYVVYCVRDWGINAEENNVEGEIPFESSEKEIQVEKIFRLICGIVFLCFSVLIVFRKGGKA